MGWLLKTLSVLLSRNLDGIDSRAYRQLSQELHPFLDLFVESDQETWDAPRNLLPTQEQLVSLSLNEWPDSHPAHSDGPLSGRAWRITSTLLTWIIRSTLGFLGIGSCRPGFSRRCYHLRTLTFALLNFRNRKRVGSR